MRGRLPRKDLPRGCQRLVGQVPRAGSGDAEGSLWLRGRAFEIAEGRSSVSFTKCPPGKAHGVGFFRGKRRVCPCPRI